ncbi:cyclic GMP-AMP synthase-like receptor 1 isoform X2 [Drosophila montana]
MIKGTVTRALNKMENKIEVDGKTAKLVYKRCGPAHTIFINESDMKYSVDFVPAIKLNVKQIVLGQQKLKYFKNIMYWSAIPKPLKPFEPNNVSFRASYYEAEYAMIKDKYKLKDVIKFMKKFRDSKQNISTLKSYYIKTLLIWQIDARPTTYWKTQQLNKILIDMFRELANCLVVSGKNGKLPLFWDPHLDLFAALTRNQRNDMLNCVTAEIDTLCLAARSLTDDISQAVTLAFSNRQERLIKNEEQSMHAIKLNPKAELMSPPVPSENQAKSQPEKE